MKVKIKLELQTEDLTNLRHILARNEEGKFNSVDLRERILVEVDGLTQKAFDLGLNHGK